METSMEAIGTSFAVHPLKTIADAGENENQLRFIKKGDKSKLPESLAVNVPVSVQTVQIEEWVQNPQIAEYVQAKIQELQHSVIQDRVIAGRRTVTANDFGLDSCAEWLELNTSIQLTPGKVGEWFASSLRMNLEIICGEKLGIGSQPTEAESLKLAQHIACFRANVLKLAGRGQFTELQRDQVRKALMLADDSPMRAALLDKLDGKQLAEDEALMML